MSGRTYRASARITAVQWFKLGDHPGVIKREHWPCPRDGCWVYWLGKLSGGFVVEPGDWIVTDAIGRSWPIKPAVFATTYELAEPDVAIRFGGEALVSDGSDIDHIGARCELCGGLLTWKHDHRADQSGLDDGPPLPQRGRGRCTTDPAIISAVRKSAWITRRAKYGPRGHR